MRFPLSLLLAAAAGCGPKAPTPDAAPSASSLTATAAADGALTGPVLEQLAASPYLYLRLKTSRGELWAAIPEAKVETGAVVTVVNPILMTKFASTSLNRTFDVVYFGTLASEGAAMAAPGGNPHAGVPPALAIEALAEFRNVKRRLQVRGTINGITVYDDFAHHPTAIATTLAGLRGRVGRSLNTPEQES